MSTETEARKLQLRCLNCFERHTPEYGTTVYQCKKCGMGWRLTWNGPHSVKVRGPDWSKVKPSENA